MTGIPSNRFTPMANQPRFGEGEKPVDRLKLTTEVGMLLSAEKEIPGLTVMWSTQGKGLLCTGPKASLEQSIAALQERYGAEFQKVGEGFKLKGLPLTFEVGPANQLH